MAVDMFLKLDGIDGGSTDERHRGEIDIESFSWGVTQQTAVGPSGLAATGKASLQDFHFVSRTGIQSPPLLVATATGQQFPRAVLTLRKAGADQVEFLKVTVENVLVTSYQVGGSEASPDLPTDQFSLSFSKIVMAVARQSPDGTVRDYVQGGYDSVAGRKI